MKRTLIGLTVFLLMSQHGGAAVDAPGGLKLLEGYTLQRGSAIDAVVWTIEKRGGLRISFEAGPSEGAAANPSEKNEYSWYREQTVSGYSVRFALVKAGLKTHWEPSDSRGLPLGNILLVTFVLERDHPDHTANFCAKVANSQEIADALLMVMTFDPSKGTF
jgi:hypothetical protein